MGVGVLSRAARPGVLNGCDPDCVVRGSTLDPFDPALRLLPAQLSVAVPLEDGIRLVEHSSLMPSLIGCTCET